MEKRNKCVKVGFSTILWAVLAIVLCAAPSLRADVTVPEGETWDIDYPVTGALWVKGTANLLPGADIEWYVFAAKTSVVNIHGGTFNSSNMMPFEVGVAPGAEVTVYGTGFNLEEGEHFIEHVTVTGFYENGDSINLTFDCYPGASFTLAAPSSGVPTTIDIDIKPGGNPNNINLHSKGVVPVAVLTTNDFDASKVNPESVTFAGASPVRCKLCDVDGDGDDDMLFHFKTQDLVLDENSTEATLMCETFDGYEITGTDTVRIIQPKK